MNEDGKKKREWVKTAAIVFLAVMLLLTFFSNTIMNYSLPEVATQYVQSGTITAKIRGSGTVESGDPYNVEVKESRKVASVAVHAGDVVEKGDILMYLEDAESEELKQAKDALEEAKKAYDAALLSSDLTSSDIQSAQTGISLESYRQQITAAQNAVKAAEKEVEDVQNLVDAAQSNVDAIQKRYDAFDVQISITPDNDADVSEETKRYNEAQTALTDAQNVLQEREILLTEAKNEVNRLQALLDLKKGDQTDSPGSSSDSSGTSDQSTSSDSSDSPVSADASRTADDSLVELEGNLKDAKERLIAIQTERDNASLEVSRKQQEFDAAKKALDDKKNSGDTSGTIANLKYQQSLVGRELSDAQSVLKDRQAVLEEKQKAVTEKQEALSDLSSQITRVTGLENHLEAIEKAQEKVDELTAKTVGATIEAPISGTVTTVNVKAGETTSAATPVAVMQPEGKGYTLSFSVTNEQARRLSVGDKADLVNAWRYDDVTVTLASIKPDTTDPGQKKLLTFDVTGSVTAGQTLNLSVGQRSANYDLIVPNSAIREDNNGKFILIVESKPGPLNTRYIATRVDVEVLASDDTQSAISAALYGYEFVITTSTKPVEAGKQVRLTDS